MDWDGRREAHRNISIVYNKAEYSALDASRIFWKKAFRTDLRTDGPTDGRTYGRTDLRTDGPTDGQTLL